MSDSTYEYRESTVPLERYEWDRTWISHTEDHNAKRVFYVGDSISWDGVRPEVQNIVGREFLIDALATSKALDNPCFLPTLDLMFQQVHKPNLIIVNNGLHGWHLSDEKEYPALLESFLLSLKELINVPIGVVLTTFVADANRNLRVNARNAAAISVAEKLGYPIIDLYSTSEKHADLQRSDGVHFSPEGYQRLAETMVPRLRELLK